MNDNILPAHNNNKVATKKFDCSDSNTSDSDSDSLEIIMMPQKEKSKHVTIGKGNANKTSNSTTTLKKQAWDESSESDDDDDEIVARARAALSSGPLLPPSSKIAKKKHGNTSNASSFSTSQGTTAAAAVAAATSTSARQRTTLSQSERERKKRQTEEEKRFKRTQTQEAREQKKRETEERKQQEKLTKAQQRVEQQKAKQLQKQTEKETKKRQKDEADQASGNFAHKEIAVLVDPDVYNNSQFALVDTFSEDFLLHCYPSALTCKKAVQWIRKDYLQGGAQDALTRLGNKESEHYEHLSHLMLILEAKDFLPLLQKLDSDEGTDFPDLKIWIDSLVSRWQQIWETSETPRVILLLHQIHDALDRQWVDHRRHHNPNALRPPTEWELQDAVHWLLIQLQVECVMCPTIESIQSNFHKMTRGLAEAHYADQVTELQCIKKIKQTAGTTTGTTANDDLSKAKDAWTRQLQMLPGLSEPMARSLVQTYPTMLSLWQAYQEGDDRENKDLVAGHLSQIRRQAKISESLYRVMTSNNPNEMIL